jgi:hypothetical protein
MNGCQEIISKLKINSNNAHLRRGEKWLSILQFLAEVFESGA